MPRRRGTATNGAGYAPVSLGTGVRANRRTPPMQLEGTDRIGVINWDGALDTGHVLFDLLVEPGIFKSLRDVAKARQYIQWHALEFKFSCGTNTAKDGSYVAAFIADPDDKNPDDPTLAVEEVAGAPGMVQDSIWRTRTVSVGRGRGNSTQNAIVDPTKYGHYTSTAGEPRFYSPGSIRALVDGRVGQAGTMVLYCTYRCTLHVQARQDDAQLAPAPVIRNLFPWVWPDNTDYAITDPGPNGVVIRWDDSFPDYERPKTDTVFQVPVPVVCSAKGTNAGGRVICPYILYQVSSDQFYMTDDLDGAAILQATSPSAASVFQIMPAGMTFTVVYTEGEVTRGVRELPGGGLTNRPPAPRGIRRKAY
nr:MAG: coat protein [Sanxia tombus-like virus 7]